MPTYLKNPLTAPAPIEISPAIISDRAGAVDGPAQAELRIAKSDLDCPQVHQLLRLHLSGMAEHSPAESIHALDLEQLRAPAIQLYCAWNKHELWGFAALHRLNRHHAELKSMRTAPSALRRGVARTLLQHLISEARHLGMRRLSLETGSSPAFSPAINLYRAFGFEACAPFANYRPNPFSRFMSLDLD